MPVGVTTHWTIDGEALRTELWLELPHTVKVDQRLRWDDGDWVHGGPEQLPKATRALLDKLLPRTVLVDIDLGQITIHVAGMLTDHDDIMLLIDEVSALAMSLIHHTGPYR